MDVELALNKFIENSIKHKIKEDDEVLGCHQSKQEAIDQMIALSIAEDIKPGGERKIHYKKKKMNTFILE